MNAVFYRSVFNLRDLPDLNLPEAVLCGRSNVGKSSFINSIFNRKNLAKTSSTPGKTRSINYYLIEDKFFIVDLPGFGYAKVSKTEREAWQKLIEKFLQKSPNIAEAFHFIDSRHPPTNLDVTLQKFLRHFEIPTTIILSKTDKLKQSEKSAAVKNTNEKFSGFKLNDNLIFYSSVKGIGKKDVLNRLNNNYFKS